MIALGISLAEGGGSSGPSVVPAEVGEQVGGLSNEEKVDTVLAVGFEGTTADAAGLAKQQGGVLVTEENWTGVDAGRQLITELRRTTDTPPLVIARQEGGEYRTFSDLPPAERGVDIGDTADPTVAERRGEETAVALNGAGFDLNLAPVADVATLDSPIADRAFGDDTDLVAEMTAAWVRGCHAGEIACAVAHFPGQGPASGDTDEGPATVSVDEATLAQRDLPPFEAAFREKVEAVVLSHAFFAAYEAVRPASQTEEIAIDLLRNDLGFKGLAITDDLSAGAITGGEGGPKEAAVRALTAGADLLLVSDPAQAEAARKSLLEAVDNGDVSEARLDQAAGRVLELKKQLGLV